MIAHKRSAGQAVLLLAALLLAGCTGGAPGPTTSPPSSSSRPLPQDIAFRTRVMARCLAQSRFDTAPDPDRFADVPVPYGRLRLRWTPPRPAASSRADVVVFTSEEVADQYRRRIASETGTDDFPVSSVVVFYRGVPAKGDAGRILACIGTG